MEAIGAIAFAISILSTLCYAIAAHSLSVIARKTGQTNTMEILAWIPVLQIAPALAVGGGSLARCLLGASALVIANLSLFFAAQFLGEGLGSILFAVGSIATLLLCSAYVGRICWNTAAARNLPSWFGLLVVVPGISFFVYPVMAFHDGWAHPHKVGSVIGLVLAVAAIAIPYPSLPALVDRLEAEQSQPISAAEWTREGQSVSLEPLGAKPDPSHAGPKGLLDRIWYDEEAGEPSSAPSLADESSVRALFSLKHRFDALETLLASEDIGALESRAHAERLLSETRNELTGAHSELDPVVFQELARHLVRIEALLAATDSNASERRGTIRFSGSIGRSKPRDLEAEPLPASLGEIEVAPVRPLPVNVPDSCPPDTGLESRTDDGREEEWCQQQPQSGGLRHGWYARYFEGGQLEQVGEYRDGLRIGIWTRFYRSGKVRAQAEFKRGLQHGWLLSFDPEGEPQRATRFEDGVAARSLEPSSNNR